MGSIHRGRKQYLYFILFVLPALFFVLLATDIPFVLNMVYSLFEWNGISKSATFVGLQNFVKVFHDKLFWKSFLFTMRYTVYYVILVNILSLFVALQLWKNTFARWAEPFITCRISFLLPQSAWFGSLFWDRFFPDSTILPEYLSSITAGSEDRSLRLSSFL